MNRHITLTENEVLKLSVILSEVQIKFLDESRHSDSELKHNNTINYRKQLKKNYNMQ